jgi:hypothetical protein
MASTPAVNAAIGFGFTLKPIEMGFRGYSMRAPDTIIGRFADRARGVELRVPV